MHKSVLVPMAKEMGDGADCERCKIGALTVYGPSYRAGPTSFGLRRLAIRHVAARHTIMAEGHIPEKLLTLKSGWAFRYRELPDRRRQIFSFLIPGDCIPFASLFLPSFPLPYSVKALTPVVLCCFSMGEMQLLMNTSPEQKREFERTALREFVALDQHIVDLGQRTALGRIAGLILSLDDRMSRRRLVADGAFEFPLRQEHIADATGLTGAHVNRVLTDMRNKGLIALPPRQLRILDRSGLVEACERR